jgi:DMSO/TMAO reductase YedYZ molybdopterin-dependent catalytic subunit
MKQTTDSKRREQRVVVTPSPENSETPLESLSGWVTPNRLFFVRNHFEPPAIDESTWRLRIEGLVERAVELSLDELLELPQRSVFSTVECAGNGRSFLTPKVHGVQWGAGAIGHAEWTGVPLHVVLERAGVKPGTVEILFEGADVGSEADHPEPMHFVRSLPLEKALAPDTLLVTRMNGELLETAHGAPLRLFVPGWYGVAAVKWLTRIEAIDHPYRGYYQSKKYTIRQRTPAGEETVVVGPMPVKSEIVRPKEDAMLGVGAVRIFGAAWAGEQAVAGVEVTVDGGSSWQAAELLSTTAPYSWVLWEYLWEVAEPGRYTLASRATDRLGRTQPDEHDELCGGYHITFVRYRGVTVTADATSAAAPGDFEALLFDMNAYVEESSQTPLDVELEFTLGAGI